MKISLFAFFIIVVISCHKSSSPVEHNDLIGKWKLTESYMDPGDGSGTWHAANPAHPDYLQFNADGSLVWSNSNIYAADHYKILNDSVMLFIRQAPDSLSLPMRYDFLKTTLAIYPPCYEGCGYKYIAVN